MTSDSNSGIWVLTPFGSQDDPNPPKPPDNQQQQNPPTPPPATNQDQQPDSDSNDDDDPYAGLSAKELKRLLKDAESGKTATEAEKKTLQDKIEADERKKKSELENAQTDLQGEKDTNASLRQSLRHQSLVNQILQDDRFTWHSIDDVIAKLPDSVKVDDEGKVSGLTVALTKVAKDSEYLVKSVKDQQNQQQNNGNQNNGPTGFQPGQGGANQGGGLPPNVTELVKNYPALASRMGGQPQIPQPMPNQVAQ
jgi:hypothetical protein